MSSVTCKTLSLLVIAFFLSSCDRDRNHPGWDYFPDMFYSIAYETYTENPNFSDRMTMRPPAPGTIPRGVSLFNYTLDPESRARAGVELINPLPPSEENILRGQETYKIFCDKCHGVAGDGKGQLFTRGLYPMLPRPVTGEIAENLKDGEIFHTITLGFNTMGAHGQQVKTDDRWKIVHYIRVLQAEARKNAGK